MKKRSKRYREVTKDLDLNQVYPVAKAIELLKNSKTAGFDETVELVCRVGADPKKSEQAVRGTAVLPHGTGKKTRVLALVPDAKVEEAREAGADYAGLSEYITKIQQGWIDFEVAVTTPDCLKEVARLGKTLGPRGLMPSPKSGTVTEDIPQAIKELKAGRIEFRMDKGANIHLPVGKVAFPPENLVENVQSALKSIAGSRPKEVKGRFLITASLSTTMGPGIPVRIEQP